MSKLAALRWLIPMSAVACAGRGETLVELNYDHGRLDAYRSAIPTEERLVAGVPTAAAEGTMAAADPAAVLAEQGVVFARGINLTARDIARTLQTLVAAKPDHFDSEQEQFVWGPWQSPSGPGEVTLSIRHEAAARDFEYSYVLARQMPGDMTSRTEVVWGGTDADEQDPERSTGLTAWDLDANAAFEAAHGQGSELDPSVGQGRFAMVYGYASRGTDSVFFNRATFRDFVAPAASAASVQAPASAEHFYGRMAEPSGSVLDFLHSEIDSDLCGQSPSSCFGRLSEHGTAERFVFGEFIENGGSGRADVLLSGGDLSTRVAMTECWNASLTRTSYQLRTDEGVEQVLASATCPGRAALSSEELGLPTPDDVQPWLVHALGCAIDSTCSGE
jgi:hypothetical protein